MKVNSTQTAPVQTTQSESSKKTEKTGATTKTNETKSPEKAQSTSQAQGAAKTEISERARDLAKAKEVASAAPDVREDKIAELKKKIQSGQYKVNAEAVADKLVDDHIKTSGMS